MSESEPLRLRVDPENAPELRLALSDAPADLPSDLQLAALRLVLEPALGEPVRLQREPGSALAATLTRLEGDGPSVHHLAELRKRLSVLNERTLSKPAARRDRARRAATVLAWIAPFAAAAAAAGYWLRDQPKPDVAPVPARSLEPAHPAPVAMLSSSGDALPSAQPSTPASAPVTAPTPAHEPAKPGELELLRDAKLSLSRDPAHALSIANRHAQLYPAGVLSQEREVIAIDALARLGRKAEASARAARFEQNHPGSAHWPHIQRLVSGAGR